MEIPGERVHDFEWVRGSQEIKFFTFTSMLCLENSSITLPKYIIMKWTVPNESQIYRRRRRVLILKKRRRVLLSSLSRSSIGQKRIAGQKKLNREDYGVDKYG